MSNPVNPTSQNCLLPVMSNDSLIHMSQTTKSTVSHINMLSDTEYEDFILYNLAKNVDPTDISINAYSISNKKSVDDTNINISLTATNNLKSHILINNDDRFIQSELFAMNIQSSDKNVTPSTENFAIIGPETAIAASDIKLSEDTKSYYDSNIKIDVTLNNDPQYSDVSGWSIKFDRKYNNMNYFAAINSHLNESGGSYPFKITEDTVANVKTSLLFGSV